MLTTISEEMSVSRLVIPRPHTFAGSRKPSCGRACLVSCVSRNNQSPSYTPLPYHRGAIQSVVHEAFTLGSHETRVHFPAASRASMSAFDSHRPLTMTPAIRELFAMFVSGLASSRMRSARLPAATVPTVDCVPK